MDPLHLLLQKVLDAVVVMRRDGTVADWNKCAEATFGWTRAEALGKSMNELIVPRQHREAHAAGLERYLETGVGPVMDRRIEITGVNRDGEEFPIELSITEASYGDDLVFIGFLRNIADRKAAELALRESEARLSATYNHALVGIGEVDRDGRFQRANEQFCAITGYSLDELRSLTLFDITHADDHEQERALFDAQWTGDGQGYRLEKRYIRKDGKTIWIELSASIVQGGEGVSPYGIRIVRDITDRKLAEERQHLLLTELNHRVKNTLAVVQGLAHQTFKPDAVPPEMIRLFEGRLGALARAHDLLMKQTWESTPIGDVIHAALTPFQTAEQRIELGGAPILLTPAATVNIALAMHELATNAAKYGALANRTGSIAINWDVADGTLHLVWREQGGPPVVAPQKRGFGTRLLEGAIARDFGGTVAIAFEPAGVVCTIDAPLARITR